MSAGTDPTPPQLTPSWHMLGIDNVETMARQLRDQGVSEEKILEFRETAQRLRAEQPGQVFPLTEAAESIGAEVHWIN